MPITTVDEVKALLQTSEYDSLIAILIPKVQYYVLTKVNSFLNSRVYLLNSNIEFIRSTKKIINSDSLFLQSKFASGNDILVKGSLHNDGAYSIATASENELLLNENLIADESAGDEYVLIQKVDFPPDISMAAADYIAFKLNKNRNSKSISLGDYSETFIAHNEIMTVFHPWRDLNMGL